jgi:hypothetical protein
MTSETRRLPLSPHPDHLRKEAKAYLAELKTRAPTARLAEAQLLLAREYGFAGWGHLMAEAMKGGEGPRSRSAALCRWRLRPLSDPDAEQENHLALFHIGVVAHLGFFLAALAGVGLVVIAPGYNELAQLIRTIL